MEHKARLSEKEEIDVWLDLCDFGYKVMTQNLTDSQFKDRLKKMRQKHLKKDLRILKILSENDKKIY